MADGELIFDTKINASGFTKGIGKLGDLAKKSVAGIAAATAAASTAISALAKQAMRIMNSSSAALKRCLKAPLTRWKNMLPRHLKMSA